MVKKCCLSLFHGKTDWLYLCSEFCCCTTLKEQNLSLSLSRKSYEIFAILLPQKNSFFKKSLCLNFNCFHISIFTAVALNDKRHAEKSMYALYIHSQQGICSFIMLMLNWIIQLIQTSLWDSFPNSSSVISRVKPSIDWMPFSGS